MTQQFMPIELAATGSLTEYIQKINKMPMLTEAEERLLTEAYYYNGDLNAAKKLILAHMRFVVKVARGYDGYGLALADLIQEGTVGMMKAVKRFDPRKGVRLVTFAIHWIKAEIHEFVLRNWRIVKVATTKAQRKLFFNLRGMKKRLQWLTNEETQYVAAELGVKPETVRQMESRLAMHDTAYDAPVLEDNSSESTWSPADYMQDDSLNPEHLITQQDSHDLSQEQLQAAMASLDERSRDILRRRWLAEKKATLHELAAEYQVSAERIRQIEAAALKALRQAMTEH